MSNPTPTQIGDAVLKNLEAAAVIAAEAAIIVEIPILGSPFLKPLLDWWVKFFLDKVVVKIEVAAYAVYSSVIVNGQVGDMNKAGAEAGAAETSGDPDAIAKALQDRIDAARALGHLGNVT